jgi:hypothetical protein
LIPVHVIGPFIINVDPVNVEVTAIVFVEIVDPTSVE